MMAAVIERAVQQLGYANVKSEQLKVVTGIVEGRDVFAVLPTGYGKSLCYACLPIVFELNDADTVAGENGKSIVAVVTPLTAIMEDQVLILLYFSNCSLYRLYL